jgi:glucokinase
LEADAPDPTPIIIKAALDVANPPEICTLALKTFISVLGSEAGNLALKVIATGGLYLGGGLSRRILPLLERERNLFMEAFSKKGIMTEMMVNIPVHVITHPQVALLGAAHRML